MRSLKVSQRGYDDLDRKLAALSDGLPLELIAEALDAGAAVIEAEEHRRVPKRSGNLDRSITRTMWPANADLKGDGMTIFIGPRTGKGGPDGWYGVFPEFGWGGRAQPWARPSVDTKGEEALGVVVSRLRDGLLKLAA